MRTLDGVAIVEVANYKKRSRVCPFISYGTLTTDCPFAVPHYKLWRKSETQISINNIIYDVDLFDIDLFKKIK